MTVLELTAAQYHLDDVGDTPTLSRSIAHILCAESPAHAKQAHPKLNELFVPQDDDRFDLGTAAHDWFLGGIDRMAICPFSDWRTNDAKEAKFRARVAGRIPLLEKDAGRVHDMVDAVSAGIANHEADPPLFADGKPEQAVVWEDEGVLCRARLDWLRNDHTTVDDLKTTSRSANPAEWSMFSFGGDLQAYMYTRAVELLTGTLPVFRFVVCETQPPYAVSVVTPGPDVLTLARKKFVYAAAVWRKCLESGDWPAYPPKVATVDLPVWLENRWLQKEEREMVA